MVFDRKIDNKQIEVEIEEFLFRHGYELVDFDMKINASRPILEIYVDKFGGITIKDLSEINGRLNLFIEASGFFPEEFQLLISSPGLDRIIKKEADFVKFSGRKIRIKLHKKSDKGVKSIEATLMGYEDGEVIVELDDNSTERISMEKIEKVRLEPDLDFNIDGSKGEK